jgi:signal transduction histidine kinase
MDRERCRFRSLPYPCGRHGCSTRGYTCRLHTLSRKTLPTGDSRHELDGLTISRPPEPYRILVVDDDPILAEVFRCALAEAAMHVTVETRPREALAALTDSRAELVLMDIHMPYCSGIELAMVIRQHDRFADIPIVFLSTEPDLDKRLAAMHLGGDDFLSKPIEGWHLARAVHARVRRARATRMTKERLLESRDAAEQSSRAKSEFLALMSHELRTPMNGILGMTELAAEEPAGPKQRHNLSLLRTSAESLLRVLNDILDYSKIEAGKLSLCPLPFSVESCLSNALEPIALTASTKGLHFRVSVDKSVPAVLIGDAQRLGQVLMNLASNAVKFTENGAVDVRVGCTSGAAELRATLVVTVADTGIGMSTEQLGRVFGVFEQGDQSTTRRYGGTGLGLAICDRLARLMGGSICVESTVGAGTSFILKVPFQVGAPVEVPHAQSRTNPPVQGLRGRILVAEDNEVNRAVVGAMVESEGHEVRFASDGREAIEAVSREAFDLVLMDVLMPNLDGIQAAQQIRNDVSGCASARPHRGSHGTRDAW